IRLRQVSPAWRFSPNCDQPVQVFDATQALFRDTNPCNASGGAGNYGMYAPSVAPASYAQTTAPAGTVMAAPRANTGNSIVALMKKKPYESTGIIPAGMGGLGFEDRPISYALEDARAAAVSAMAADPAATRACRNTVVVLVTGGKDDGAAAYTVSH